MFTTSWGTNLAAAWAAQFLCIVGVTAASPFLPLYIRELGITQLHEVEFWSGLLAASTPIAAMLTMPFWGALADRHGHKANAERASLGIAATFVAMAFVNNAHQLLVLRILQGFVSGLTPALTALICTFVPRERIGFALGMFQMATYAGTSIGPLAGGLLADTIGYQWTFAASSSLCLISAVVIIASVREKRERSEQPDSRGAILSGTRTIKGSLPILMALMIMGAVCLTDTESRVTLPLFVETLQYDPSQLNRATGLVLGTSAFASAISSLYIGRLSDRAEGKRILMVCSAGAAFAYGAQAISPNLWTLIASGIAAGLFGGGLLPAANRVLAHTVRQQQQGIVYGLSASINSAGNAMGPLLGAAAATAWGLRAPFVVAALVSVAMTVMIALFVRSAAHPTSRAG